MSQQLKPIEETIEVPKETGKAGLLRVLEGIIDLKRVVEVRILASRPPVRVFYKRFVVDGEPDRPLAIDLESLSPYAVLRNGEIQECDGGSGPMYEGKSFSCTLTMLGPLTSPHQLEKLRPSCLAWQYSW